MEGPPKHQTDVTKDQAHGKTIGSFIGDYRAKAVASGQAHWLADHYGQPPTFPFGGKLPGEFLKSVPSATRQVFIVDALVSPLYKFKESESLWRVGMSYIFSLCNVLTLF